MSGYHGSKISGSQQSFLTEMAICIVERWKKSMGHRFVPECNRAQESHSCHGVNCHHYFVVQIDSCEVEAFEGLSVVQAQISKLTVHQSVHLLKVKM